MIVDVRVFKTDISSATLVDLIMPLFNAHPYITDWSVDFEDIDNVLRVVSNREIEEEIIELAERKGFICYPLPD